MKEQIIADLKRVYKHKPHRLDHVFGVLDTAVKLGKQYNLDTDKLELAALLHDCTKYMSYEEHVKLIKEYYKNADDIIESFNQNILHAFSAVVYANKQYHITDKDILGAIEHHTIGKPDMNLYEEILFISDYIEPNRTYDSCIKTRELVQESLHLATYTAINDSIKFFERAGDHIPKRAYEAREFYRQLLEETT